MNLNKGIPTQLVFTCSKSILETLEKVGDMFSVNKKKHQNDVIDVVLVFLLLTLNIFHTFFWCF